MLLLKTVSHHSKKKRFLIIYRNWLRMPEISFHSSFFHFFILQKSVMCCALLNELYQKGVFRNYILAAITDYRYCKNIESIKIVNCKTLIEFYLRICCWSYLFRIRFTYHWNTLSDKLSRTFYFQALPWPILWGYWNSFIEILDLMMWRSLLHISTVIEFVLMAFTGYASIRTTKTKFKPVRTQLIHQAIRASWWLLVDCRFWRMFEGGSMFFGGMRVFCQLLVRVQNSFRGYSI